LQPSLILAEFTVAPRPQSNHASNHLNTFAVWNCAMPIVAITDYTFPSLDIETAILQAAGF
jgi:hypothetical protein